MRLLANRFGFTDRPDGQRKLQSQPVPLGGGIAVLLAVVVTLIAILSLPTVGGPSLLESRLNLPGLMLAAFVIAVVGTVDDYRGLRGRQKLLGQFVAALIVVASGFEVSQVELFGYRVQLGLLSVPLTVIWLLGAINALNLLDGLDGLATSLGIVLCVTIAAMAHYCDHSAEATIALVVAASLGGFLCFNLPPATIYLGDTGSMLIGLIVGSLSIQSSIKGAATATVALAVPIAICAIPIFDSSAAVLRRTLTGRSIYACDRGHIHHYMLSKNGIGRSLFWFVLLSSFTGASALVSVYFRNDVFAIISILAVGAAFVTSRMFGYFGYVELQLVASRAKSLGLSLLKLPSPEDAKASETTIRLQGSRQWELLWTTLTESVDKLQLNKIRLDVNIPALHEGFHARWDRASEGESQAEWSLELPLVIGDQPVGALSINGQRNGETALQQMEGILVLLEPFEQQFLTLTEEATADTPMSLDPALTNATEDVTAGEPSA